MSQSIAVLWVNASPATREIHSGEISELLSASLYSSKRGAY